MIAPAKSTRTITLAELESAGCYLLHYEQPYMGRPSAPTRHYLGYSRCIGRRITEHAQGKGAHYTKAVHAAGIVFEVAAIWPHATRTDERTLKRRHRHAQLCPICRGASAAGVAEPSTVYAHVAESADPNTATGVGDREVLL